MRFLLPSLTISLTGVFASNLQLPLQENNRQDHRVQPDAPCNTDNYAGITSDPSQVVSGCYDYVIAGGGLTGLTLASKLVEANFKVLVIESGYDSSGYGSLVDDLNTYGQVFGTSIDHAYETSPQLAGDDVRKALDKDTKIVRSGNGLGGSTILNGGTWTRPHKCQLDSWRELGNKNWGWDDLEPFMKEIAQVRDPDSDDVTPGSLQNYTSTCHGPQSPEAKVLVGARDRKYGWSPLIGALMNAAKETCDDVVNQKDLCCGDPTGVSMFLNTLGEDQVRSTAATSWLYPVLIDPTLQSNLAVLTGQLVGKVHLKGAIESNKIQYAATGVEFGRHHDSANTWNVSAQREVLLAAGAVMSPLILQWSGIGPEAWLKEANITPLVELPVGQNLQDQTTTSVVTNVSKEAYGQGQAAFFATFKQVLGPHAAEYEAKLNSDETLDGYASETVAGGGFHDQKQLLEQYTIYRDWLLKDNVSYAELFLDTDNRTHFDLWTLIPFTRGYVKALHSDPYLQKFEYNPRFFQNEIDVVAQAAATWLARNLTQSNAMSTYTDTELVPGDKVHREATLTDWADHVKQSFRSNYHSVGTCSMMSYHRGGVVDSKARVYNVTGLRVVDASIPPTQLSSHLMTVLYAMAAKIAKGVIDDARSEGNGWTDELQ